MEQENYILSDFSIEALQNGDERAFEVVFASYYQPLCFFAERVTKDSMAAEEIATTSLLKLWKRHRNFADYSAIKAFLYITVKNACLDYLGATQRRERHYNEYADNSGISEENILDEIYRAEVLHEIYYAIEQLPEKYRQILKLAYGEGLKNGEIAQRLNIPLSTVNTQKARGLSILKKTLSNKTFSLFLIMLS